MLGKNAGEIYLKTIKLSIMMYHVCGYRMAVATGCDKGPAGFRENLADFPRKLC
jgi:hypothetical protein